MATLIDGLLDYSRLEHRELRLSTLDPQQLIEETLSSMAPGLESAGARVKLNLASRPVQADKEGLRIILRNLLDNALKFRSPHRKPEIDISAHEDATHLVIAICDNGIGFDAQHREQIFAIFNRLHATGYEGTGIGLALVRKAAQRMQGSVWADARPDQGATFFVSLPLADALGANAE